MILNKVSRKIQVVMRKTLLAMFACLFIVSNVPAQTKSNAEVFLNNLDDLLAQESLPDIKNIISVGSPQNAQVKGAVIGDFKVQVDDGLDWGVAIPEVIRHKLSNLSDNRLLMPPLDYNFARADSWSMGMPENKVLNSEESYTLNAQRNGLSNIVYGGIIVEEGKYQLFIFLYDITGERKTRRYKRLGGINELPFAIEEASIWIAEWLTGVHNSSVSEELALAPIVNYENLELFATAITLARANRYQEADPILRRLATESYFPTAARCYLGMTYNLETAQQSNENFLSIASLYPKSPIVRHAAARRFLAGEENVFLQSKVELLKKIVADYPDYRDAYIDLSYALSTKETSEDAVVLSTYLLNRWPEYYRSWWMVSKALFEYAWALRGNTYYVDVPEKGKRLFPPLTRLAEVAIEGAIEDHPDAVRMWVLKIRTLAGYSPEAMEAFENAIRLAPDDFEAYTKTMNLCAPKWGGSLDAQLKVCQKMVENNPGEGWTYIVFTRNVRPGLNAVAWTKAGLIYAGKDPEDYPLYLSGLGGGFVGVLALGMFGINRIVTRRRRGAQT